MLTLTILTQEKLINMKTVMTNYLLFYLTSTSHSPTVSIDRVAFLHIRNSDAASVFAVLGFNDISLFAQPNIGKYLCQGTRIYFHSGTNLLFTNYPNIRSYIV
jgi:hypothetical protein